MKVLIMIFPESYHPFVAEYAITFPEYSILTNAVSPHNGQAGCNRRIIEILCDKEDAFRLLVTASRLYPDMIPAIAAGVDLVRQP
jgi:hypothetical protein